MKPLITITFASAILCFSLAAGAVSPAECNRECLSGIMTKYLDALSNHDASKLPVTKNVKYTENGVRLNLTDGLWQTASAAPTYQGTFNLPALHFYKVRNGKIFEIEAIGFQVPYGTKSGRE